MSVFQQPPHLAPQPAQRPRRLPLLLLQHPLDRGHHARIGPPERGPLPFQPAVDETPHPLLVVAGSHSAHGGHADLFPGRGQFGGLGRLPLGEPVHGRVVPGPGRPVPAGADVAGLDFQDVPLPGQGLLADRGVKAVQRAVYQDPRPPRPTGVQDGEVLRTEYLGEQQNLHPCALLGDQPAARPVQPSQEMDATVEPDPVPDFDDACRTLHRSACFRRPAGTALTRVSSLKGRPQAMLSRPFQSPW